MRRSESTATHGLMSNRELAIVNRRLAFQYRDGDVAEKRAARDAMVYLNQRLIHEIARPVSVSTGVDLEDLSQEGNFGLLKAIERYNPDLPFVFSTYAAWWVRASVRRAAANQATTVRVPVYAQDAKAKLSGDLADDVYRARGTMSLDWRSAYGRALASDLAAQEPDDDKEELVQQVRRAVKRLPERQRYSIRLRYGLGRETESTFSQMGKMLGGVSPERARQILMDATKKLKRSRLMEVAS